MSTHLQNAKDQLSPQKEEHRSTQISTSSRKRVLAALRHEEPDRIPIDLGGMASTGITAIAYAQLNKHLGIASGQTRVFDIGQQLAEVELEILTRFGVDVISLENSLGEEQPGFWKPWKLPDGTACQIPAGVDLRPDEENGGWLIWENGIPMHRMSSTSLYFTQIAHPLAALTTSEELQAVPRPVISDEELKFLEMRAKFLYENTDFAIMANFGGSIHEIGQNLRGWAQFMMDLARGDLFTEDLIAGIVETQLLNLSLYLEAVGDYVVTLYVTDSNGCYDTAQKVVEALPKPPIIDLPIAFTPNGDNINDIVYLHVYKIRYKELLAFKIYNRWGQVVFETENPEQGWDGTYQGKPQNTDTYVYMVKVKDFDDNIISKSGYINLLR